VHFKLFHFSLPQNLYNICLSLVFMAIVKALIGLILLNVLIFGGYYFYQEYFSEEMEQLNIFEYNSDVKANLVGVSSEVVQFSPNMRFNHNDISYFINSDCSSGKRTKMLRAFDILSSETDGLITFYEDFEEEADILVGCSQDSYEKEENVFVAGEGGPTKYINTTVYPVILKGKVLLFNESRASCDRPVLELHELIHVFGFDHINDSSDIMYPYLDCDQQLNPELVSNLKQIYETKPFAELYFENVSAITHRSAGLWYLDFNVTIFNNGILDAKNVILEVYADNKLTDSPAVGDLDIGVKNKFYIKNLKLGSKKQEIRFEVKTSTIEYNQNNNILTLKV